MLTYGDHERVRDLHDERGVRITPVVYRGHVNGGTKDGRRDLIIERVAR
ncbi:MAG TPA: hypothetical protein QGH10_21810 [Armatimonadota bacterium]|nr:hypothetical protein [Armatimonadota bacterium]